MCVMIFRHINSAVMSRNIVKSYLSRFIVAVTSFVFSVYHNPDLWDKFFEYLLTAIATMQSVDRQVSFFVCWRYVNAHHEKWFGSSMMTLPGRATRDFALSRGCK